MGFSFASRSSCIGVMNMQLTHFREGPIENPIDMIERGNEIRKKRRTIVLGA